MKYILLLLYIQKDYKEAIINLEEALKYCKTNEKKFECLRYLGKSYYYRVYIYNYIFILLKQKEYEKTEVYCNMLLEYLYKDEDKYDIYELLGETQFFLVYIYI